MNKGGRPFDPVWQFFTKVDNDTKVKCVGCGTSVSAKIERLKNHRARCVSTNEAEIEDVTMQQHLLPSTAAAAAAGCSSIEVGDPDGQAAKRKSDSDAMVNPHEQSTKKGKLQQPQINNFGVTTDRKTQDQLDEQVARFFFSCNIPFAVVEHPDSSS